MKKSILNAIVWIVIPILFAACDKDEPRAENPGGKGNMLLITSLPNPDGMTGTTYMQLIDKIEGQQIGNENAIPIPYGSAFPHIQKDEIFVFPSYMGDTKNELIKYTRTNGVLNKTGVMKLPANSSATSIAVISPVKAYLGCAGLGKIIIFNPQTMTQTAEINLLTYGVDDNNPDVGAMIVRDNLAYIGLNQMVGGWTPKPDRPYSDILIIDTQTDKVLKTIIEMTSNISMATRPIHPYSIFMDEKKDIYISCMGAFGMLTNTKHRAGVLRIKAGETDFDKNYMWNVSTTPIEGESQQASFLSTVRYMENGKAYGYANILAYYKPGESGHNAIADRAIEIDIWNKKLKVIDGLDLSNGWGVMVTPYKNNVLIGNSSAKAKGIYLFDTATGKLNKSSVLNVVGNPSTLHYFGD